MLNASLEGQRIGSMLLRAPVAGLHRAPRQAVNCRAPDASRGGPVTADGRHVNAATVALPRRERPVVRRDGAAMVGVPEAEESHVDLAVRPHESATECGVGQVDVEPFLRIDPEGACGGAHEQCRDVCSAAIERVVRAIEGALHRRKPERTDEALAHALRLERGERGVLGRAFHSRR